jgi:DNA-binding LacI/PurR family transcriptional regulator
MKALSIERPDDQKFCEAMRSARNTSSTIYDVASLAGLSISTVSRVLNSPDQVNEATRAKVLAAIDQLGYVPKAEARARALQSTRRIGVLTPFFTSPSFVQRLRGIDQALARYHYELIVYTVDSLDKVKGYLATLPLRSHLDGLIIMSLPIEETDVKRLIGHHLGTVLIEFHQPVFSSVEVDDVYGGKIAVEYLITKGHRRLGFIGDIDPPDYAIRPVIARLAGFQQGLIEANIPLTDEYICCSTYDQEPSRQAAYRLLSLSEPPTAIFAAADVQAIAVLKAARDMGLKIPQDLAVIGFDDLDMADFVGLTTVRQCLDDSGRIAAELLLGQLADPDRPVQHIQLPLTIVERETV